MVNAIHKLQEAFEVHSLNDDDDDYDRGDDTNDDDYDRGDDRRRRLRPRQWPPER